MEKTLTKGLQSAIATRIGELRALRNETLDTLAAKSGVSKGMISRIEREKVGVSVETLSKISEALGVSISDLLRQNKRRKYVVCARNEQPIIEDKERGFFRRTLSPTFENRSVEFVHNVLKPGCKTPIFPAHRSGIEEHIFVLSGELTGHIDGEKITIAQGECLYFDASVDHSFRNDTHQDVSWVLVMSSGMLALKT